MSYIPPTDKGALDWMVAFSSTVSGDPALYGIQSADSNAIAAAVAAYQAAYNVVQKPATNNPVTVAEKDEARNSAEEICRQYAIQIKHNAGISAPAKIAAGVRPVNPTREPINPPASSPLLNVLGSTPGSQTVRYADTTTPNSGAKPFAAANLQLFVAVDDNPVVDPEAATFIGAFTRNPIGVLFTAEDNKKTATYFARWSTAKGDTGPWSTPVSLTIAA